jgi:hypothetical protein
VWAQRKHCSCNVGSVCVTNATQQWIYMSQYQYLLLPEVISVPVYGNNIIIYSVDIVECSSAHVVHCQVLFDYMQCILNLFKDHM